MMKRIFGVPIPIGEIKVKLEETEKTYFVSSISEYEIGMPESRKQESILMLVGMREGKT